MSRRTAVVAALVVVFSLGAVAVNSSSASARSAPVGVGTVTCSVDGSVSFEPPLTYSGQPAGRGQHEVATVEMQLTGCTGSSSNTPQPNPVSATQKGNGNVHIKATKVLFMTKFVDVLGPCGYSDFEPDGKIHFDEIWQGAFVAKSEIKVTRFDTIGGSFSGTSSGSYAGGVIGSLNLTADSSSAYNAVCNGDGLGSGSVPDLDFDPSTSQITIGVPAG